jgi:hypothetical protein
MENKRIRVKAISGHGTTKPDETKPDSDQMKWLSRGLFEALIAFIARASGDDASNYKLRAMLYEFHYLPIGKAFGAARKAGADVPIRYEAQSYIAVNEEMIAQAGIKGICKPQKSRAGVRHNKFIVLGTARRLWRHCTGMQTSWPPPDAFFA